MGEGKLQVLGNIFRGNHQIEMEEKINERVPQKNEKFLETTLSRMNFIKGIINTWAAEGQKGKQQKLENRNV